MIRGVSVHFGLPLFSAGLSISTDSKDEFIYLVWKELGFLGEKKNWLAFFIKLSLFMCNNLCVTFFFHQTAHRISLV